MSRNLHRHTFHSMGCPCEIGVFSTDPNSAKPAIAAAEDEVHRLDKKYSHFRDDSYITKLQIAAQRGSGVDVDPETASLLDFADTQFKISEGLFDITCGRLTRLWHRRKTLPSEPELSRAMRLTGWDKLQWRTPRLSFPKGMQLELGGLVKEYAADRAALMLKRHGAPSAFVELGGDIHITGPRPDGNPWNMGIRNPAYRQQNSSRAIADIPILSGGLATSGDYERASVIDGKRYGHIIHPATGWPIKSFKSVSVHAPSCLLAGALSTLAMLMGHERGLAMLRESGFSWMAQAHDNSSFSGSSYGQLKSGPHHPSSKRKPQHPITWPIDNHHLPSTRSTSAP